MRHFGLMNILLPDSEFLWEFRGACNHWDNGWWAWLWHALDEEGKGGALGWLPQALVNVV